MAHLTGQPVCRIRLLGDLAPADRAGTGRITVGSSGMDLIVVNLETPLPDHPAPRSKSGPVIAGQFEALDGWVSDRLVLSLANNHMMDHGESGLEATLRRCRRSGCSAVGAGRDLDAACEPAIREANGVKVGVLGVAETQFGMATPQRAGVAPIIPGKTESLVRSLAEQVDVVIVSVHGAGELCPWPSPSWQQRLRGFIDAGAMIVHGHHAHVPQGYEQYKQGVIVYGLGNFLVDPAKWRHIRDSLWSLVVDVAVSRAGVEDLAVGMAEVEDGTPVVARCSTDAERAAHGEYLARALAPLSDPVFLTGLWQEYAVRTYGRDYVRWLGFSRRTEAGVRQSLRDVCRGVRDLVLGKRRSKESFDLDDLLRWYHLFACESHRDAISSALGVLVGELEDMRSERTRTWADEMMPWSLDTAD